MSLKLTYYGQNDSVNCSPAVFLTGDPGTDQQTLTAAGYLGGVLVSLVGLLPGTTYVGSGYAGYALQSAYEPAMGSIGNIVPVDGDSAITGRLAFATLLNGPGEFAGAIGPSGSRKAPVVRALWQGNVDFQGYDAAATFVIGNYIYAGGHANTNSGLYTDVGHAGASAQIVGICSHIPTATEPWLGVISLL
jgi:hypothetical protein